VVPSRHFENVLEDASFIYVIGLKHTGKLWFSYAEKYIYGRNPGAYRIF
jgi:hypothetical protein